MGPFPTQGTDTEQRVQHGMPAGQGRRTCDWSCRGQPSGHVCGDPLGQDALGAPGAAAQPRRWTASKTGDCTGLPRVGKSPARHSGCCHGPPFCTCPPFPTHTWSREVFVPLVTISTVAGRSPAQTRALSDAVHQALVDCFHIPVADYNRRLVEYAPEDFVRPPGKSAAYVLVEMTVFPGRSREAKKRLFRTIVESLGSLGGYACGHPDRPSRTSTGELGRTRRPSSGRGRPGIQHQGMSADSAN